MKKKILYLLFNLIYILAFLFISISFVNTFNSSAIQGVEIILLLLFVLILLGFLIGKIIFNFTYIDKKIKKLDIKNFEKNNINKNIKSVIIIIFVLYTLCYLTLYFYSDIIFGNLPLNQGIINSCQYISKIYFLSLPLYSFEIAFLEYCSFIQSYKMPIIIKLIKLLLLSISSSLLLNYLGFNGMLYSKILTDLLFFIYYLYQLKRILLLCQK